MAEKRYYWLKLKEDYFNNPKIKKLRKIAGGDTFTIIYLKMQLFSISNNGIIEYEGIENSFDEEIALKLDEDLENVQLTLAYLKAQGLIETNNNEFLLVDACNNIGSEGDSAKRVRAFREKGCQKALKEPKSNALRQRQFRAKEICLQSQHIPLIEDYINNKRYNGNYYLVFKRDEMKCAICGKVKNLCVHHIDGFDENKPENSNENKMITLCRECHSQVHSKTLEIPKLKLESIGYFDECNESNEMCNGSVTSVKQNSISISLSNSISNNKENNKEKEYKEKESMLNEDMLFPDVEVESGSTITAESQIFDFWNECNIIKHRDMTDNIKKAITKALKTYTREDICKYIKRYAIVLEDDKYFFNYKWTLIDFLNRKDGISSFSDEGSKWINFVNATGYTEREEVVEEVSYEDKESF